MAKSYGEVKFKGRPKNTFGIAQTKYRTIELLIDESKYTAENARSLSKDYMLHLCCHASDIQPVKPTEKYLLNGTDMHE